MKNLTNRTKVALTVLCYLGFTLFMNSCKDDDTPPNCGCESETLNTVPSDNSPEMREEQTSGLLFYKRAENKDFFDDKHDGRYNDAFWIFRGTFRISIICNAELLDSEYDFLKTNNDSIPINFTGTLKRLCVTEPFAAPVAFDYSEIKLTSIERQ